MSKPSTSANGDWDGALGARDQSTIPGDRGGKDGSRYHLAETLPFADSEEAGIWEN